LGELREDEELAQLQTGDDGTAPEFRQVVLVAAADAFAEFGIEVARETTLLGTTACGFLHSDNVRRRRSRASSLRRA
jgi:hypothetical protein